MVEKDYYYYLVGVEGSNKQVPLLQVSEIQTYTLCPKFAKSNSEGVHCQKNTQALPSRQSAPEIS